jgi:hypothetical protein
VSSSDRDCSEDQLQRQLDVSTAKPRAFDKPAVQLGRFTFHEQVGVVEDVEDLPPEPKGRSLGYPEVLVDATAPIVIGEVVKLAARRAAVLVRCKESKSSCLGSWSARTHRRPNTMRLSKIWIYLQKLGDISFHLGFNTVSSGAAAG